MRRHKQIIAAASCALAACAAPARAQAQTDLMLPQATADAPAPGGEALSLARALVAKMETSEVTAIPWLGMPMGMFMAQLHIRPREHARIVFAEAVVPILQKHADRFREIEAEGYARVMSLDELRTITAFYDSPAGLALVRIHLPLAQMNLAGLGQLLTALRPEMQTRVEQALKAHGWEKG